MSDENKTLTPVWICYVDGKRLDTKHEGALKKIIVKDTLNGVGKCSLLFDTSAEKLLELGDLSIESEVSVHLGYKDDVEEVCERIKQNIYEGKRLEILEKDIDEIRNGNYISKIDKYFNAFYKDQETILDYLDDNYIVFVDELNKVKTRSENIKQDTESLVKAIKKEGRISDNKNKKIFSLQNNINNLLDMFAKTIIVSLEKLESIKNQNPQDKEATESISKMLSGFNSSKEF